ncbi:MAG: ATP-binding protein [Bacteroidota bacterium]
MRASVLLWICLFFWNMAATQSVLTRYRTLSLAEGLPNPAVYQTLQDQRGFLWFATRNGIARFDGLKMKIYDPAAAVDSTAVANEIPTLYESASGQLWLGYHFCPARLFRYDIARDTFLPFAYRPGVEAGEQPLSSGVRALWDSPDHTLWVATGLHGLLAFDLNATSDTIPYRHYRYLENDPKALPSDFMAPGLWQDKEGQIWALTEDGLACYRPTYDDFKTYRWGAAGEDPFAAEGLSLLADTTRGCFWIGTINGLLRLDMETGQSRRFQLAPGASLAEGRNWCHADFLDKQGRVWLGFGVFPESTLWVFDPDTALFSPVMAEEKDQEVQLSGGNHFNQDRNGTIWVSSFRGIKCIDVQPPSVRRVGLPLPSNSWIDLNEEPIVDLVEDSAGRIWLGTWEQGVWLWDRRAQTLEQIPSPPGSDGPGVDENIYSLELSPDGAYLWLATSQAVYRLQLSTRRWRSTDPFPDKPEYSCYKDILFWNGGLWGSCFGQGVFRLTPDHPDRFVQYSDKLHTADSLWEDISLSGPISLVSSHRPGRMWLGLLHRGLWEWDDYQREFQMHLSHLGINVLYEQNDSLLWIGAESDLYLYNFRKKRLIALPHLSTFNLRQSFCILSDQDGLVWVGYPDGILALDPHSRQVVHQVMASEWTVAEEEWFRLGMFCIRTSKGSLFFASAKGLVEIRPNEIVYNQVPPQVALQELRIGKRVWHNPDATGEPLVFHHSDNDLELLASVLHYRSPEQNQLFYRLDKYDEDWRSLPPNQSIEYPNLPPGNYRLLVKATNSDGIESAEQVLLSWRIRPPWYVTGWAYLLYGLVVIGSLYTAYRWQLQRQQEAAERRYWEELDTAKSQLFANISHEFRTPLTLILGESQSLLGKLSGAVQGQALRIQRSGKRLLWLVNQLLDLARADSGFLQLEPQQANILPFLRYSLQAFATLAEPRNIELRFLTNRDSLIMDYDPERLQRVLSNLLLNAVKYVLDGGRVTLQVEEEDTEKGARLRIAVHDTGPGIGTEDLPLIFDRFHRAHAEHDGVGIGLAVAQQLVELMEGTIEVYSTLGEGTTFTIILPITRQAPLGGGEWVAGDVLPPLTISEEEPALPSYDSDLPRLLIVEDNADLRTFLRTCLNRHYQLSVTTDGQEGLEMAKASAFDLIISDVMMPRMDGFELCRALKADPGTSHVPLILLTARADLSSRLQGLARGAEAYLTKPFEPVELRLRVAQLLKQREQLRVYYRGVSQGEELPPPELPAGEQEEHAFVQQARRAVLAHLAEETFGVEALARTLALSRSQLHRKLSQLTDRSASRFMRSIRLAEARRLLRNPQLTIAEAAYACGFRDPDYFTRVFRDEYGLTPTTFRGRPENKSSAT